MSWKSNIVKILVLTCWCLAGVGVIALLVAAVSKKNEEVCKGYEIRIHGASEQLFLEKSDIIEMLSADTRIKDVEVKLLDLRAMESKLERHAWIKDAQIFIDNNSILKIKVDEREPVARIFTVAGNSFYIDSACERLPLTEKIAVRLPVFTGFPSEGSRMTRADRLLMRQIKEMSEFISRDAFWSAQITQIDVTPQRNFEMIPTVGNHIIEFGDGTDIATKFNRLFLFYKQVMSKAGMNAYERVNVQYARQVVGKKKAAPLSRYDSLMAVKKIQQLIFAAQRMQPDTLRMNVRPLEQSNVSEQQLRNLDLIKDTTQN
jgi:cell division protein FtsQ